MKRSKLLRVAIPLVLAGALIGFGLMAREHALAALTHVASEQAIVPVQVISPQRGPATRPLVLPGTVRAWYEAPIFAQVAGYVSAWNEDFGASVKAGQLLATIDAPSLDAQYAAAKANLKVAEANYHLATSTAARWQADPHDASTLAGDGFLEARPASLCRRRQAERRRVRSP